jgi:hypothetical protein
MSHERTPANAITRFKIRIQLATTNYHFITVTFSAFHASSSHMYSPPFKVYNHILWQKSLEASYVQVLQYLQLTYLELSNMLIPNLHL